MSSFSIKLLAMASMICDHVGYWLYSEGLISYGPYHTMRAVGRLAFPLFCYLIVIGFEHSSDRKKYLTRLTGFALISQLPFTVVFSTGVMATGPAFVPAHWLYIVLALILGLIWYRFLRADLTALLAPAALILGLSTLRLGNTYLLRPDMNVFFTLALALAAMGVMERWMKNEPDLRAKYALTAALIIGLLLVWDRADYGINGILLIIILRLFSGRRSQQLIMLLLWCLLQYNPMETPAYFVCAAASAIPIALYNGKKGKNLKTAFYLVYPLHLSLLALLGI